MLAPNTSRPNGSSGVPQGSEAMRQEMPPPPPVVLKEVCLGNDSRSWPSIPVNLDIERAVLAAILIDNDIQNEVVDAGLRSADFFLPEHGRIFECISAMKHAGVPVDLLLLCEELSRRDQLETAGGMAYISALAGEGFRTSSVKFYVDVLRTKAALRNLMHLADRTLELAAHPAADPEYIASEMIHRLEEVIKTLNSFRS